LFAVSLVLAPVNMDERLALLHELVIGDVELDDHT
jgi:hypothetical protein